MSRAVFATDPSKTRGRYFSEQESPSRSVYQRDRDRILHSASFRKLQHKTQVFVFHEGDYYRSRLTHSLEVAQIARSISRTLGLDEDLTEALALAHDLGHPPFAHAGEEILKKEMAPYGGFNHNAQTLRLVTTLDTQYAAYTGLNLTWEMLEGIAKHNGPVHLEPHDSDLWALKVCDATYCLELDTHAGPEAQVAALSDDIAYDNHDFEDGVRAGLLDVPTLCDVPLVGPHLRTVSNAYPNINQTRLVYEAKRRLITEMITDLVDETRRRIAQMQPHSVEDVRRLGQPLVAFSDHVQSQRIGLKDFMFQNMYRHYRVNRMASKVKRVTSDLFRLFLHEPNCLPAEWAVKTDTPESEQTARVVCDFIAGMTDRFAFEEHQRLFDLFTRT